MTDALDVFEEALRQISATQVEFQRALSETHRVFLDTASASLAVLAAAALGDPVSAAQVPRSRDALNSIAPPLPAPPLSLLAPPLSTPAAPALPLAPAPTAEVRVKEEKPAAEADTGSILLEVVAEKTGYPVDLIDLDMQLDSDLGIDSIKRVELLSAVRERAPWLANADTAELTQLGSLREIMTRLSA